MLSKEEKALLKNLGVKECYKVKDLRQLKKVIRKKKVKVVFTSQEKLKEIEKSLIRYKRYGVWVVKRKSLKVKFGYCL